MVTNFPTVNHFYKQRTKKVLKLHSMLHIGLISYINNLGGRLLIIFVDTYLSVSFSPLQTSVEKYPWSRHTTTELRLRVRDRAESTVDTGSSTAHTPAGRRDQLGGLESSFTAACWD